MLHVFLLFVLLRVLLLGLRPSHPVVFRVLWRRVFHLDVLYAGLCRCDLGSGNRGRVTASFEICDVGMNALCFMCDGVGIGTW